MDERQEERFTDFSRAILSEMRAIRWILMLFLIVAIAAAGRAWPDFWGFGAMGIWWSEYWTDFTAQEWWQNLWKAETHG